MFTCQTVKQLVIFMWIAPSTGEQLALYQKNIRAMMGNMGDKMRDLTRLGRIGDTVNSLFSDKAAVL